MTYLSHLNKTKSLFMWCLKTAYILYDQELWQNNALCFNFDACPMHSPFGFVHFMH